MKTFLIITMLLFPFTSVYSVEAPPLPDPAESLPKITRLSVGQAMYSSLRRFNWRMMPSAVTREGDSRFVTFCVGRFGPIDESGYGFITDYSFRVEVGSEFTVCEPTAVAFGNGYYGAKYRLTLDKDDFIVLEKVI